MSSNKRVVAEQLIQTSTTPPSDVGIYRVNRNSAIGILRQFQVIYGA